MYSPDLEYIPDPNVRYEPYHPDLERVADRKQSYIPGLEFYRNSQHKFLRVSTQPRWPSPRPSGASPSPPSLSSTKKLPQLPPANGSRILKTWIIVILTAILVATVVAAGVVIAIIVKKQDANKIQTNPHNEAASSSSNTYSLPKPTTTPSPAKPLSFSSTTPLPTSNCPSLNSIYTVPSNTAQAINADVSFRIDCGRDLKLPLVMGIRVFRFEDCIRACASHATNALDGNAGCVAVVYKPNSGQPLTCWLKGKGGAVEDAVEESEGVDAAILRQG
ncbi:MAG: hypothetical protein Q9208_002341 [Pyrenodesmia sp. 3 TL-2023]